MTFDPRRVTHSHPKCRYPENIHTTKTLPPQEIPIPFVGGVWIFYGTAQSENVLDLGGITKNFKTMHIARVY